MALLLVVAAAGQRAPAVSAAPGDEPVGLGVRASVSAGELHSCALTAAGGVKCWGQNVQGQLGDGTTQSRPTPGDVVGLPPDVRSVDAGARHTCAVTGAGAALCWGDGSLGQVGDGGSGAHPVPVGVAGLGSGVRAVTSGSLHSCALLLGGAVKCWGQNTRGQLGDGTSVNRPEPVDVVGLGSGVRAISAGADYTCALTAARGVVCWGANGRGQLGDGTTTDSPTPVAVAGLADVSMIDTGVGTPVTASHTCAVILDGTLACWGNNNAGQLGDGTFASRPVPAPVLGLPPGVQAVATGGEHTCALTGGGALWCWGQNNLGQLGNGTQTFTGQPVPGLVPGLDGGGAEVTASTVDTCALARRGGVSCWGSNIAGQVGDGSNAFVRLTPTGVSGSFRRPECPALIAARHTTFTLTNGYALGSRATFAATSGYVLDGPAALRCQTDGTWSGTVPPAVTTGTVSVVPDTGLVDGQEVTVTLRGWPGLGNVGWCQAVQRVPASPLDCGNGRVNISTPTIGGTVVATLVVSRRMSVGSLGRVVDCAVEECFVAAADLTDIPGTARYAPLSFAPP